MWACRAHSVEAVFWVLFSENDSFEGHWSIAHRGVGKVVRQFGYSDG